MPHSQSHLPQEILGIILGEVVSKADAGTCSLVCRNWVLTARRSLFRTVTLAAANFTSKSHASDETLALWGVDVDALENECTEEEDDHDPGYWQFLRTLHAFVQSLATTPSLAPLVRTLKISAEWDSSASGGLGNYHFLRSSVLHEIVASLPRLRTLVLYRVTVTLRHCRIPPALTTSLQTLVVNEVAGIQNNLSDNDKVAGLLGLTRFFPSLREFDFCGNDNFSCEKQFLQTCIGDSSLSRFRQRQRPTYWSNPASRHPDSGRESYKFLSSLIEASGRSDVHLDVEMVFPESSAGFPFSLLQRVGPRLQSLIVRLWWGEFGDSLENGWGEIKLGLSFCTSLRTITLDFHSRIEIKIMGPLFYPDLMRRVFRELFEEGNSPGLSVTLDLPQLPDPEVEETLREIDEFGLAYRNNGFVKLIILSEDKYLNGEAQLQVRKLMPQLSARGILTFRN